MILPYNTDAPIYYFPYTTISLIVVNAAVFFVTTQAEPDQLAPWILMFGNGLHPLQWVTHAFLHASFLHLLGNMFFLWGFGLVVEGKLGWWRMLLVYLISGAIYGALVQFVMLGSHEGTPGALGASGVIFGLMAMALVWAPRNEMSCFVWIFRPTTVDLSIILFATAYLFWQLFWAWFNDFGMSSEMLHLSGAAVGAVFGVALLKLDIVDCEGWDLFSVFKGIEGKQVEHDRSQSKSSDKISLPPEKPAHGPVQFRRFVLDVTNRLLGGDAEGATKFYAMHRDSHPEWHMDEADLMALIRVLHEQKQWSASLRPMADYLRQFPQRSARMRLKLAQILINSERRPSKAIEVLSKVPLESLPADLQAIREKLLARAEAMKPECELEVADGDEC